MQETWVWSLVQEDPLEKEMATHSSILAWRIPWTEELCELQSIMYKFSYTHALSHNVLFGVCYATYAFPCGSVVKNLPANAGDMVLIPGPGRSLGEGNGNPLQYSCLENPMDRGTWWITVHGVHKDSNVTWWLNKNNSVTFTLIHVHIPAHE